jgi:epoxyqueuosine reductase
MSPLLEPDALAGFRAALRPHGLPLVGVADGDAARGLGRAPVLDGAASVLVVASGGRAFWERLQTDPALADLRGLPHPIDETGQRLIGAALATLPAGARLLAQKEADTLDLRRLAALAGVGWVSPVLELLLHPEYGPWLSIRGVVTLPVRLQPTVLRPWDPCGPCAKPCLDACPVGAYGPGHAFDVERCAVYRLADEPSGPCASRCASRDACVVGPQHRYGDAEMRHRHRAGLPMIQAWLYRSPAPGGRASRS